MNISIVIAWIIFSFLFWRSLRRFAVEEDRIIDLTLYITLVSFFTARLGFALSHWNIFSGKSPLLFAAIWVLPGLSWLTGFIGGLGTCIVLCRRYKIRVGLVLDTLAVSLPVPIIFGEIGSFLSSVEIGRVTHMPWAIRMGSDVSLRHPVQWYEMLALVIIGFVVLRLTGIAAKHRWPYGLVGIWFFILYSFSQFVLEFIKETRVYWGNLSANQWVLIGIFAECIGVLYVRGGGREQIRPLVYGVIHFFQEKGRKLHESISRRNTQRT